MSNSLATVHPELIAKWSGQEFTSDTGQYNPFWKVCSLYLFTFIMGFGLPVDFQAADEYNKCQW